MQELFETFNDNDEPTGLVSRGRVHRLGLWHKASNVFLFRPDGQLITQRRHDSKDVWPGAWDLSVAEHLKPREDFLADALATAVDPDEPRVSPKSCHLMSEIL